MMKKEILYVDLDNCVVNFVTAFPYIHEDVLKEYKGQEDNIPNIFSYMSPMDGAVEAVEKLAEKFDLYFLSTAPWENPTAWSDKLNWVKKHFPTISYKRLILSHNKQLNIGEYLIDDRTKNGAGEFTGELVQIYTDKYKNWNSVLDYLIE